MKKVKIYTTPYCPFCIRAKQLLKNKNIDFQEIDLSKEPEKFDEMSKKSNGARTVPQIFVDDTHIGDCDYIHELDNKGELDKILGI
ncbi:MAG: glutaredoxin 3 [Pelagibacteraceae bacterium]|nr:glutaredoxin 3 [Pelagibacteraceae bacterium]MCI5078878.1 glutaredoxin 3 [Pelagibacteraceae bacterium]